MIITSNFVICCPTFLTIYSNIEHTNLIKRKKMEKIATWQAATIGGIITWVIISSFLDLNKKIRSLIQPWVTHHVISGIPFILQIQKSQNKVLDALFSGMSCAVSVSFYTAFLPLLYWSGHGRLARQMTLLMAFCDYIGNCIKDVVSAPRPSCPPVRRLTITKDEEENAQEYGLPSSHTLNTVCLSGFLLHYVLSYNVRANGPEALVGFALVCLIVGLIAVGRIYLGMHSLIDVIVGFFLGLAILAFWLQVHEYVDNFVTGGQNVTTFWAALSFLLFFAYPTPEFPTPSYEFHTAFNGVSFGIIAGVQQTYHQFHHENVPRIFSPELTTPAFMGRMLVGIPTILLVKFCSKALAKWTLPIAMTTMGIPIKSSSYVPTLIGSTANKKPDTTKQPSGILQRFFFSSDGDCFDVDTGIRFVQYAGMAWSVVDLVPSLFSRLNL